jgi:hypothetical protein
MKHYGDFVETKVITKRKIDYITCDCCKKVIEPSDYGDDKNQYTKVNTWHNDWGNDSVESHEMYEYCVDCAKKVVAEYIENASGSEELKLENRYLLKGEME